MKKKTSRRKLNELHDQTTQRRHVDRESDEFSAEKGHLHDDTGGGGHGGTEMGWLVSYADMMTLLFGLFVILYSLRTDKTKDADEVMKAISKEYFSKPSKPPVEPPKITQEMLDAVKVQLESEKHETLVLQNSVLETKKQNSQLQEQYQKANEQVVSLSSKVETLESIPKPEDLTSVNAELKQKNAELNARLMVVQAKIKTPVREPQSVPTSSAEDLRKEMEQVKVENEELKKELDNSQKMLQTYLMIVLTWETEKHDLDLSIITPGQKMFDFRHRKVAGEPGEFQIDSRYGPGIEMWKAENFRSGHYKIKSSFYNSNGNPANAKARLSIITNSQTYRSDLIEIPISKKNVDFDFEVDPKGKISVGPAN